MRICRYNADKLGLIKGDQLIDVTSALDVIPKTRWPKSHGDEMINHLQAIIPKIHANRKLGYVQGVKNVDLKSPIANPTKIIIAQGCCRDYRLDGWSEADEDLGKKAVAGEAHGIYLKATSSLVGAGGGAHGQRRQDAALLPARGRRDGARQSAHPGLREEARGRFLSLVSVISPLDVDERAQKMVS